MAKAKIEGGGDRDLFGDPVVRTERGRGRPAHQRTRETVNRVILGLARGWKPADVAKSIGISLPTLKEHYSSELQRRAAARLMMESVQMHRLNDAAEKGNVGAEKQLLAILEKGRIEALDAKVARRTPQQRPAPKGKKEAAKDAAAGVKGKFAPPDAPSLLNPAGNA